MIHGATFFEQCCLGTSHWEWVTNLDILNHSWALCLTWLPVDGNISQSCPAILLKNLPRVSSVIVFEQLQDQFSHRDSDWPRFLYDSLSLCEHKITLTVIIRICSTMKTLTVIMSNIFSLDSTDGQSEISSTFFSIPTESTGTAIIEIIYLMNDEFRSFSRFLLIPM